MKLGPSDNSLRQYFTGFGHLLITATKQALTIDFLGTKTGTNAAVDSTTGDLASNTITDEVPPFDYLANENKRRCLALRLEGGPCGGDS